MHTSRNVFVSSSFHCSISLCTACVDSVFCCSGTASSYPCQFFSLHHIISLGTACGDSVFCSVLAIHLMLLPLLFAAGLARNPDQPWDCMQVAQTVSSCCMPCSYFNSVRRRLDMHYTSPSARTTSRVCKTAGTGSPENYRLQVAWSQRHITYLLGDSFASRQALYVSFVM